MLELISNYPIVVPYLAIISIIAVITTVKDKICAKLDKSRTPEKKLLIISAFGGSAAMLATMLIIRHKTKHFKFMIGIPVILALQVIILYYLDGIGILI